MIKYLCRESAAAYLKNKNKEQQCKLPETAPVHLWSPQWHKLSCGCRLSVRPCVPLRLSVRGEAAPGCVARCAPDSSLQTDTEGNGKSQPRSAADDMTLHGLVLIFSSPTNTLLLNLCLHSSRASVKGSHPPYILKETRSCTLTRWLAEETCALWMMLGRFPACGWWWKLEFTFIINVENWLLKK